MMRVNNPWKELNQIQRQFDQLFNELAATPASINWTPALELEETPQGYILRTVLPNLDTENLEIQASQKAVAISGQTHKSELTEGNKILYSEFPSGRFHRVVNLPEAIAHSEVKAEYNNNILTLTMPKAPEVINRVVKVSLSGTPEVKAVESEDAQTQS